MTKWTSLRKAEAAKCSERYFQGQLDNLTFDSGPLGYDLICHSVRDIEHVDILNHSKPLLTWSR